MSDQELPITEGEGLETVEIIAKEEVPEATTAEQGESIDVNEEKKEEASTEETVPVEATAEGEETAVTEETPKEEGITDQPSEVENAPEEKQEPPASETAQTAPKEPSEVELTEEKTDTQQEEVTEGAEGTPTESEPQPDAFAEDYISVKYEVESPIDQAVEELEVEAHPLDELSDQQVIELVNEVEMENRHLELENILFENFLKENDPSLLEGLDEIMAFLIKRSSLSYSGSRDVQDRLSVTLDRQKLRLDSYTSITSIAEGKGPKINLSQKTDMVMRAMEENQANLETFLKKSHIAKRNLKSELEEFSIREAEIKEAIDIFEFNVVTQGLDKLTQRIPAEKFVRYMEEWLKSAQLQIEKLRLRIATLKVQYKKVSQQLIQRQELGENVHAVDFDQLEIENKHFIEKIEQKNNHLIELKKMNGGANLVLSTHKKFLQKQQDDCNKLEEEIQSKNFQIEVTERECDTAEEELNEIFEKYQHCKNLKNQYTVPDVMEYVRLKGKLHELRKNMKIWVRRRKIQDIALSTCLREMKNLTGNTNIDPNWFQDDQSLNSDDVSDSEDVLL